MKQDAQPGLLREGRAHASFLTFQVEAGADCARRVARFCARVPWIVAPLAEADPPAGLTCTVGFGSFFWDAISRTRPKFLRPFGAIEAGPRKAPATGGDLFLHICSHRVDLNFDCARKMIEGLEGAARVLGDIAGFTYRDSRDLTGFLDGTANPRGPERAEAALIGSEDAPFAGGSYALAQRYVHDLGAWSKIPETEQEKIVGRTKAASEELPPDRRPPTAHITRAELREGDVEFKIVRQSLPYGNPGAECGLYFLAYARDPGIFEQQLARMMGSSADGLHDRLMDFSHPVSGAFFFMPSLGVLESLGR